MMRVSMLSLLGLAAPAGASDVAVCPGEGARYGDHKCNHDQTHRVCAQLLASGTPGGEPLSWGEGGDFWKITGQKAFQWDEDIRNNNGDSWCICMWATAHLIQAVGCDNVHLHCEATDVAYVLSKYTDGGTDLAPAKACLQKRCGAGLQQKSLALPASEAAPPTSTTSMTKAAAVASLALGLAAVAGLRASAQRRQSEPAQEEEMLE